MGEPESEAAFRALQVRITELVGEALMPGTLEGLPAELGDETDRVMFHVNRAIRLDEPGLPEAISQLIDGGTIQTLQLLDVQAGRDPALRTNTEHRRYLAERWSDVAARWQDYKEQGPE